MTQPDAVQPVVQPGGDLPTVGTHDTEVVGTFPGAGQPTETAEEQPAVVLDPMDENYSGLVEVKYTGSEDYEEDGVVFTPGETKVVNAVEARKFLGNGSFEAV